MFRPGGRFRQVDGFDTRDGAETTSVVVPCRKLLQLFTADKVVCLVAALANSGVKSSHLAPNTLKFSFHHNLYVHYHLIKAAIGQIKLIGQ